MSALELTESGASPRAGGGQLWDRRDHRSTLVFGLQVDAGVVRERIEQRTREMFERGVEEEVRAAVAGRSRPRLPGIHGLQDVTALLAGEIDREEAIRRLDARTRRYAKRQRVWMRRLPGLVPVSSAAEMTRR